MPPLVLLLLQGSRSTGLEHPRRAASSRLKIVRFLRLQRGQRLHLWYIGKKKPVEVLTVRRVRHITFASSCRPARTGNTRGHTRPTPPPVWAEQGNMTCASLMRRKGGKSHGRAWI